MIPEGYERDKLSKGNQTILKWLDAAVDELENIKYFLDDFDEDIGDGNLLGKIKEEFCLGLIDFVKERLCSYVEEVQITLAEASDE